MTILVRISVLSFFLLGALGFSSQAQAGSQGLTIHAVEIGVGKFHREDHRAHAYAHENAWYPTILPQNASTATPLIIENADTSYTVFFSTLEEILTTIQDLSKKTGLKIQVLNVHGHGLPGAMWFPKDQAQLKGFECGDWQDAASAPDQANYQQYYGVISKNEIMQIRAMSNNANVYNPCTTGLKAWQEKVAKFNQVPALFMENARVHFLSCVVGLGSVGDAFTKGIAALLLKGTNGHVETSMMFGLGDWSMPEGMGFWDYQSDDQLNRDNANYPVNRRDRDEAQKGSIRVAKVVGSVAQSGILAQRDFMSLGWTPERGILSSSAETVESGLGLPVPSEVRIPGTRYTVKVLSR